VNITAPFVLQDDVVLIPCADLSDDMRGRISFDEGDFTLSRRHGRALTQVIDGETAALLSRFREPCTIVDAVFENSRSFGRDAKTSLDEVLPHLETFLDHRVLVPAGSKHETSIRPRYDTGTTIGGWEIVRCASLIEDTEIYQLRKGSEVAALKIARTRDVRPLFDNEASVLRHLDGSGIAPRLIDSGEHEKRPYLILEWANGVEASVAAAQRRCDRTALIEICASIAAAYATLHARGVLHADVHPRNVIVGEKVLLLDFGYSRVADRPPVVGRAGVNYFFEPEYPTVEASPRGEQYAIAALLYLLLAGDHYLDFRLEREEMARQIANDPPLPFAKRGIPPWPDVEAILFRALEKHPERRHVSVEELAALLAGARDVAAAESLATPVSQEAKTFLESTLQSFARRGAMFRSRYPRAPKASINFGCAGAAAGMLRIAEARGDPALLALSRVWCARATSLVGDDGAFYSDEGNLSRESIGDVTPYHTESGVHAARAMIAAASGIHTDDAVDAFLAASRKPCAELDLTLGRSGSLLAASMLLALGEHEELRAFGTETKHAIWSTLRDRPSIDGSLGMAHGWTGYLYAALRWCAASGDALPSSLIERLHELASLKIVEGRGAYWPSWEAMTASWCNGSAGQVFLFALAHRLFGDAQWLQLAELAAWHAWDEPRANASLCCGTAGRAYALLNLYKQSGAKEWLSRARQLANDAARAASDTAERPNALWKGELGVAVLIADLASPENARMPFFE